MLGVGFKNRFLGIVRIRQTGKFMSLKGWITWISLEVSERFLDLLYKSRLSWYPFETLKFCVSRHSEDQRKHSSGVVGIL